MSPRLLLLTGSPASGKTQLAARLMQRYEACACTKDEIKERLLTLLGERDALWSRRLSDASFALLFDFAPRLLAGTPLLLMEGNFRRGEHERPLAAIVSAAGAELAQILCRAELATRVTRLAARAEDPNRHPGHRDRELDLAGRPDSDFLDLPGPRWVFRSDGDPAGGDWATLCSQIDAWYGAPRPRASKQ